MHVRLLRRVLERFPGQQVHILEVASGRAEALQAACHRLQTPRHAWRITLLDRRAQHLPRIRNWPSSLPAPGTLTGDALGLPLPDKSADVVSCCLFLHHLDEEQALRFLREALRVARFAVVINDLERSRTHYLLARLFSLVDPSRISRHDGPISVLQAYTREEVGALLAATERPFELVRGYLFRLGAIVWQNGAGPPAIEGKQASQA